MDIQDVMALDSPGFVAVEKELAKSQEEARQIVLAQPGVSGIKWALDHSWLKSHGIAE